MHVANRIVADVPTSRPGLGFEDYAEALAEAIFSAAEPQFTVGLYGKWGSGKSSLLKAIERLLGDRADVLTVEFDAWRYQRTQEIVIPLLHAVHSAAQASDPALAASIWRLVKAFGKSLGFKIPVVGAEFSIDDVAKAWNDEGEPAVALDDAFARPFHELRRVGEELGERRIVIFVDDLDRCTSENVVAMLESINVITDVRGFVFVLALDYDVLVQAVKNRYPHASGHEFIEKIIQVPFRIPRIASDDPAALETLVPGFQTLDHLVGIRDQLQNAADIVFLGNPRSVKRFINALTLSMRVLSARRIEFDAGTLSQLLALELRWPDEFRDVRTAVSAGDADPLQVLRESEDDALRSFAGQVPLSTADALDPLLRFTASVAETVSAPESVEVEAEERLTRSEIGRERVESELADLGFELHSRSSSAYYHAQVAGFRVVVAKQVVRIERELGDRNSGRPWSLVASYRFTTELETGLEAIAALLPGPTP
ncbi:P-loop NTPase fold protein [Leifsonia sp. NPDC058194]|uniref:KAP family P-loop NTPase fold protein n=1 Tax=Leifsonia sp. NPDC058194 TaxID=3346374 RepID=UPI0036DF9FE4